METNVIIAILLIILAFVVLIYMSAAEKKKRKKLKLEIGNSKQNSSTEFNIDIKTIMFPYLIDKMKYESLTNAFKVVFDTFCFLEYSKKTTDEITTKEWHSWQFAILLKYLSKNYTYTTALDKKIFPVEIEKLSKIKLDLEVEMILKRYYNGVDVNLSKEELCEQVIWTARDVAVIIKAILDQK